jgi:hypothetical protein
MSAPGVRRLFRAKNPEELANIRASLAKQNMLKGIGTATVSRAERGHVLRETTARRLYEALRTDKSFEQLFELAMPRVAGRRISFSWPQLMSAAGRIGRKILREFRADLVLTFSGHSAIFASLAMVKALPRKQLLNLPTYLVLVRDLKPFSAVAGLPGFTPVPKDGFVLFIPDGLSEGDHERKKRIAIIDDSIVTGEAIVALKGHLYTLGYKPSSIRVGCFVCQELTTLIPERRPDFWEFTTSSTNYRLPWGDPLWFPNEM